MIFFPLQYLSSSYIVMTDERGPVSRAKNEKKTKNMKTLNQILAIVITLDPALKGFEPTDLPEAARARIANTSENTYLEAHLSDEELLTLHQWSDEHFKKSVFSASEGECCYYLFADHSLYFRSSGDSEVWACASDFASDRILNGYDGPLDRMDSELLTHLGNFFAEAVAERGIR
jgi:hypothetical protein